MDECNRPGCEEPVFPWLDREYCSVWHRIVARRHTEGLPAPVWPPAWPVVGTST